MSFFIIIRGPLGSGKTTIAKELAEKLNGSYFSIDKVMKANNLDVIKTECIPLENFIKGDEIVLPDILIALNARKIVIIDGCFYHEKQIEHLTSSINFKNYVFTLKTSLQECIKRDSLRSKSYGKEATNAVFSLVNDYGTLIETKGRSVNAVINSIILMIQDDL